MAQKVEQTVSITSVSTETVIGAETKFKGTIVTDKPLRIEGTFEGEIKSQNQVYISEKGSVNAEIECKSMKMLGKGEGKITCTEILEFGNVGEFKGDVVTKNIVMGAGSKLDGNCKIGQ